ncbi:MAG: hypothetical protein H0V17_26545, partial [Deltaproteobacteria bacterium]|nr:hypothetical protein [Deltaproteobacteria bacterium]
MGKLTAFVLLAVATGCQPMYDGPSESLPKVRRVPHQAVPEVDPVIPYVDTCATNFRGDPTRVSIDRARATELVITGDTSIKQAEKIEDPRSRTQLVATGIDHYRNALVKDPYDAEATLKLALAYDKVYRRGCALKLLARISMLEGHPKFRVA